MAFSLLVTIFSFLFCTSVNSNGNLKSDYRSSMCFRCGVCITLAIEFNQLLEDTYLEVKSQEELIQSIEAIDLPLICKVNFLKYRVCELGGTRFICRSEKATKIFSNENIQEVLNEKCNKMLQTITVKLLVDEWEKRNGNLMDFLCKGRGEFGACRGMLNCQTPLIDETSEKSLFAWMSHRTLEHQDHEFARWIETIDTDTD